MGPYEFFGVWILVSEATAVIAAKPPAGGPFTRKFEGGDISFAETQCDQSVGRNVSCLPDIDAVTPNCPLALVVLL